MLDGFALGLESLLSSDAFPSTLPCSICLCFSFSSCSSCVGRRSTGCDCQCDLLATVNQISTLSSSLFIFSFLLHCYLLLFFCCIGYVAWLLGILLLRYRRSCKSKSNVLSRIIRCMMITCTSISFHCSKRCQHLFHFFVFE